VFDNSAGCFVKEWMVGRARRAVDGRGARISSNRVCECAVKVEFNPGFRAKNAKLDRIFAHFGAFSGRTVAVCASPCAKLVNPWASPSIAEVDLRRSDGGAAPHG
jgi:hypothetical protein